MSVVSFSKWRVAHGDWSQKDLASLYRAHDFLNRQGLGIGLEKGLTDLGEPWCVFYDIGSEEVVAHFARNQGRYLIACGLLDDVAWGDSLDEAIDRFYMAMDLYLDQSRARESSRDNQNVVMHPATRLVFGLSALFFLLQIDQRPAQAAETDSAPRDKAHDGWVARVSKYVDVGNFNDAGNHHFLMAAAIGLFFAGKSSIVSIAEGGDIGTPVLEVAEAPATAHHMLDGNLDMPNPASGDAAGLAYLSESHKADMVPDGPEQITILADAWDADITAMDWHEVNVDLASQKLWSDQAVLDDVVQFIPTFEGLSSPVIERPVLQSDSPSISEAKQFVLAHLSDFAIESLPDDSPVARMTEVVKDLVSIPNNGGTDGDNIIRVTIDSNDTYLPSLLSKFIEAEFDASMSVYQTPDSNFYLIDSNVTSATMQNDSDYYVVSLVFDDHTVINLIGLSSDAPDLSAFGVAA